MTTSQTPIFCLICDRATEHFSLTIQAIKCLRKHTKTGAIGVLFPPEGNLAENSNAVVEDLKKLDPEIDRSNIFFQEGRVHFENWNPTQYKLDMELFSQQYDPIIWLESCAVVLKNLIPLTQTFVNSGKKFGFMADNVNSDASFQKNWEGPLFVPKDYFMIFRAAYIPSFFKIWENTWREWISPFPFCRHKDPAPYFSKSFYYIAQYALGQSIFKFVENFDTEVEVFNQSQVMIGLNVSVEAQRIKLSFQSKSDARPSAVISAQQTEGAGAAQTFQEKEKGTKKEIKEGGNLGANTGMRVENESEVADFIAETAANNLSFTAGDFRREFEDVFERKATPVECTLFQRKQREVKEREKKMEEKSTSANNVGSESENKESDGRSPPPMGIPTDFESYEFRETLGEGSFGCVYRAEHTKTRAVRAVKVIALRRARGEDKKGSNVISGEMKVGTEIGKKCTFLVEYEQVKVRSGFCFIVMEYCAGGNLGQHITAHVLEKKPFKEKEILQFVVEVGMAIQALHSESFVHRDIKPQNIFLTMAAEGGSFKLGDYGTARLLSKNDSMSMKGTLGYTAPEVLQGETNYLTAVDIYSFGCILFEMIELRHPFINDNKNINFLNIQSGKHNPITSTQYDPTLLDLAERMISVDASKRPSIKDVLKSPLVFTTLTSTLMGRK